MHRAILPPAAPEEAEKLEVLRGPNIKKFPDALPQEDTLQAELVLKVGDNITTDHIMPAGAKFFPTVPIFPIFRNFASVFAIKAFRSGRRTRAEVLFVGGLNYGQGSSREHAALVPALLGCAR